MTHFAQWVISYASTFTQHLDLLPSNSTKLVFLHHANLQCCYHSDIATVSTFSFLRAGRIDGPWDGFSET